MAKGDVKPVRYSGRGNYRSASTYSYDDEGRGKSKSYYEAFEAQFEESGHSRKWLLTDPGKQDKAGYNPEGLTNEFLFNLVYNSTYRYNLHDWAVDKFEDPIDNDGRSRRLVVAHLGEDAWILLQERAKKAYEETMQRRQKEREAREAEHSAYMAALEAERIKRQTEQTQQIRRNVDLVAGSLQADFQNAFTTQDVYAQDEGEWIDDPVTLYQTGYGYGMETSKATGIKLQITLSIDLSNSMIHNRDRTGTQVYQPATETFRDLWLALEDLERQHPNDLFIGAFTFSADDWKYKNGDYREYPGRKAECLSVKESWRGTLSDEIVRSNSQDYKLGPVEKFRDSASHLFAGTDTWYYPLFEKIEAWEKRFSDPGAVKLDLILTDAVIEHPTDISRSDKIQERRDGALHTVMLNFLPKDDWAKSDLPLHCIQYPADRDNLGGLLRTLISEFVSVYI